MKAMYYIPKEGIFFPEHNYEICINLRGSDHITHYQPENLDKVYQELKKPFTIVEIEHGVLVNTEHMVTCEIITNVNLSDKFKSTGWHILSKEILRDILSDKGQTILMAESMNVHTSETFNHKLSDVEDLLLNGFMSKDYASKKFNNFKNSFNDPR